MHPHCLLCLPVSILQQAHGVGRGKVFLEVCELGCKTRSCNKESQRTVAQSKSLFLPHENSRDSVAGAVLLPQLVLSISLPKVAAAIVTTIQLV